VSDSAEIRPGVKREQRLERASLYPDELKSVVSCWCPIVSSLPSREKECESVSVFFLGGELAGLAVGVPERG